MAQIQMNVLDCGTSVLNTGLPTCYFDPKNIYGAVHIPKGKTWTQTELLTFKTVLQDAIAEDSIADRIFPIKTFEDMEDKSSESVMEDTKYGGKRKVRDGKYSWYFTYTNGGTELNRSLKTFDNQQEAFDVLFIDNVNNGLIGVSAGDYGTEFGGFNLELLDVPNFKINDGSASTKYQIGYSLQDSDEVNNSISIVQFEPTYNILKNLNGLKNIKMVVHTAMATGLIKFKLMSGGVDLADYFSTELADVALYTSYNNVTGLPIVNASMTYVAATKTFNLLLTVADANYIAAGSGGLINIELGDVTALVAAGVVGYGNSVITVPRGA